MIGAPARPARRPVGQRAPFLSGFCDTARLVETQRTRSTESAAAWHGRCHIAMCECNCGHGRQPFPVTL